MLLQLTPAHAQSITQGMLEGRVRDQAGNALVDAGIRVTESATGVSWSVSSDEEGRFQLFLLRPGDYDIFVEEIGYQPRRIEAVPVGPGDRRRVELILEPVQLPVDAVAVGPFPGPAANSRAGVGQRFRSFEIVGLPEERRELTELGRLSTVADEELAAEGLPGWMSQLAIDGIPFASTLHPDLPPGRIAAEAFPLSGFEMAELMTNAIDVEWSGAAGPYLSAQTRRGSTQTEARAYGDWTSGDLTSSDQFGSSDVSTASFRGGAVISGPIIRDTAHYAIGIDARRLESSLPRAWEIDDFDAELLTVASDSFGVDIEPYTRSRVAQADLVSGFGRFHWQINRRNAISARANGGYLKLGGGIDFDPDLGAAQIASLGSRVEGNDISIAASLNSVFSSWILQELRVGIDRSERNYIVSPLTGTRIVDGGLAFGTDPAAPGEFARVAVHLSETLHYIRRRHQVKAGVAATFESFEQRYAHGRGGIFTFGGPSEFAGLEGSFAIADRPAPFAEFSNQQFSIFLQDTWSATRGLDVLFGLRYEIELLDDKEVNRNQQWLDVSGLDNKNFDDDIRKLSARAGFVWDVSERHEWLVRGAGGIYHDRIGTAAFGELVTQDGSIEVRRAVGALGSWPAAPDPGTALFAGRRLTLIGPDFEPPRSGRASLGVTRLFPDGTAVHVAGNYRITDRLPRRDDLNRPLAPTSRDQHGRPIFGSLVKRGSLVAVEPGSNRRFSDFDLVSALNADGSSRYWGATVAVERHTGDWLDLLASYTHSQVRDDWLSASAGGPERELNPFPDGLNGMDWADGVGDLDVPHRAVVGVQLRFPQTLAGTRLAALYRFRSGRPFTPGFRDGVDVNGDGSGFNDPAFVDPSIPGVDELLQKWDCLADQEAEFAERNSCRGPDAHLLDARLALGLVELQGRPVEIVLDGLNLLDTDTGVRDRALFLIDREADLLTNPDGSITLPLVANPNFGEPLVTRSSGRVFRVGIRVGL